MTQLIVFRGLQGLGAGALFPISLAIIGDLFTPRERGRYQGLFGAVFGLSFIIGPFIGGWLTDNVSWHWVFYVNMPIGIAALLVIASVLPNFHPETPISARDLDYAGIVVFSVGVVFLLLGLTNKGLTRSNGTLYAWTDPTVGGFIAIGVVILALFLFIESRAKQPIIPLALFGNRTFSATNTALFMVSFGMFASVIFLPRYYQGVKGISATESGYMIWPLLLGLMGASIGSGMLISRIGRYKWILTGAMVLVVAGSFLMTHIAMNTTNPALWLWMLVMGLGIGPSMSGSTVVVQNSAPPGQMGVATSTLTFVRQVGGSVGLAIAGTVFGQSFAQLLPQRLEAHGVPARIAQHFNTGASSGGTLTGVDIATQLHHTLPAQLQALIPRIVAGIHDAFSLAIGNVFWLPLVASFVALLAFLLVPDLELRGRPNIEGATADVITGADVPANNEAVS